MKGVLSLDKAARGETTWLTCCWEDCEKQGYDLHRTRFHDHAARVPCDSEIAKHVFYVFCSEPHRQLFLNSHRDHGNMAPGHNKRFL